MRAILVGIGDKAIELVEGILSSSQAMFEISESEERTARVRISTFFVPDAGDVQKIPATYHLKGPVEVTRESLDFSEQLPPGSYELEITPKSNTHIYPIVKSNLLVERDDESIEAKAEVYTRYEVGGERGRQTGPLTPLLLLGILGILLGSYRLFLATPSSLPTVLTKFLVMSVTISSLVYYLLRKRYSDAFTDKPPLDIDLRVLLGAYLGFLAGMGLALLVDYLAIAFPLGPLSSYLYPSGGFAEEVLMLLLGSVGSLLGLITWLLTRVREEGPAAMTLTLQDWIATKRRLILTLLTLMLAGSIIGGTLALIVGGTFDLKTFTPIALIPLISFLLGIITGLLAEYFGRDRRWEVSAPLIAAAGAYSLVQALLSYASVLGFLPEYLISPITVLSSMNIVSAIFGILAIVMLLKDVRKPRFPSFSYTRTKIVERKREPRFRSKLVGVAISAREHPLERAREIRETERIISKTLGMTVPLILKVDLEGDFGREQIKGSLSLLFEAIVNNCGRPPESLMLVFDSYMEPDLTAYLALGLSEILESIPGIPALSVVIASSSMLEERIKELQEPLKSIESISSTVFVVDYETFAHSSLSAEEVNTMFIRKLTTALGSILEIDEVDGTLKLGPKDLNKLLRDPKEDPFGTICLSELDPDKCEEGVTPDLVRGLIHGAISRPFARYTREEGTWAILLLRGPRESNYLWAAKSELEMRYSGKVVAISDIPTRDPLTAVILISGLQIEEIPVISGGA